MRSIFFLNLYPELSMNMRQVKVECDKWQCSGKMLCLVTSGGDDLVFSKSDLTHSVLLREHNKYVGRSQK